MLGDGETRGLVAPSPTVARSRRHITLILSDEGAEKISSLSGEMNLRLSASGPSKKLTDPHPTSSPNSEQRAIRFFDSARKFPSLYQTI